MKAITNNTTNIVDDLVEDAETAILGESVSVIKGERTATITSLSHSIVNSVQSPDVEFIPGAMTLIDGAWAIENQERYNAKIAMRLAKAKTDRKSEATKIAKEHRDGPITISGTSVKTDNGHIAEMSGALEQFDNPDLGWTELDFTNSAGQAVTVNKAQLQGIYNAACAHRQAWRSWEASRFRAIDDVAGADDSAKLAALRAIDLNADWPV